MPVKCPHCEREFNKGRVDPRHLRTCVRPPDSDEHPCLCGYVAPTSKLMKVHRKTCGVWQGRDKKAVKLFRMQETMIERHGVASPIQSTAIREKTAATNIERYGAANPFSREASTFDKVQTSLDGKRPVLKGADNPFAREDVKAKVRAHWMQEHGVTNPQQVTVIRERTRATNQDRYGGELLGSPVLADKIRATNQDRYGDVVPQRTDAVKEKQRETNLERWGVPWTGMHPEIRARQLETHHAKWGSHYFASDEGKAAIKAAMVERYGVEHPSHIEGWWDRMVATFRERYGVGHPLQLAEFLDKRRKTVLKKYGVEHVLQNVDVRKRMVTTKMEKYGNPWGPSPMGGPNGLERRVMTFVPEGSLLFTGDFSFWRWLPALGHHKNPDFIVPGPDPTNPKKGVTRVVEAFGDFWHSRMFTGKAPFEHERELIEAYADVGLECLVIWESEVKSDPAGVQGRLEAFLSVP